MSSSTSQEDKTLVVTTDDGEKYELILDGEIFTDGICKDAYKARMTSPRKCDVVIKTPKKEYPMQRKDFDMEVKKAEVAEELAKAFNKEFGTSRPLHYRQPIVMKVITGPQSPFESGSYVLVEAYLEGEFIRWNNNWDYVNEEDKSSLQAFSHFTFEKTNGKLLICDIQGVKDKNQYVLTDPAIHSDTQGKYGGNDFGPEGMEAFFTTHSCENYCSKIGLKGEGTSTIESKIPKDHATPQKVVNGSEFRNDENTVLLHGLRDREKVQQWHSSRAEKTFFNPQPKHQAATNHPSSLEASSKVSNHVDHLLNS